MKHLLRAHVPGLFLVCAATLAVTSLPAEAQTNVGVANLGSSTSATVTVGILTAGTLGNIAVVTQGASGMDFTAASGGSCAVGTLYAAGATCTVTVDFTPKFAGTRYGAVVLSNATGVQGTAYLQGTGAGAQQNTLPSVQTTVAYGGGSSFESVWNPSGVAVDGSGNVYFSNNMTPYQFFKATPSSSSYVVTTVPNSGLVDPFQVAVDGAGNVYVADSVHYRVLKETNVNGSYEESTVASFPQVYASSPLGVAVDGGGNVYISLGVAGGVVYKETLIATGYLQSTVVTGLPAVADVAVGGDGTVYSAVNVAYGWIDKETPSEGGYTQTTIPIGNASGIPDGVAVDGNNNVYIAYTDSVGAHVTDAGQIFKETLSGGVYTQSIIPTSGLVEAFGVAVDDSGDVFVADYFNGRIVKESVVGQAAAVSFSVAVAPETLSVTAGQSLTAAVSVTPENGFSSAVSFACSGLPAGVTCSFSPATVTPAGATASTTMTVKTAAKTADIRRNDSSFPSATLCLIFSFGIGWRTRRRRLRTMMLVVVALAALGLCSGCGSGSGSPSVVAPVQPGTSTFVVTGTAGLLQSTTTLTLTIN